MLRDIHYTSLALRKEKNRCLQGCSAAEDRQDANENESRNKGQDGEGMAQI
jgi:hypothetical protein